MVKKAEGTLIQAILPLTLRQNKKSLQAAL